MAVGPSARIGLYRTGLYLAATSLCLFGTLKRATYIEFFALTVLFLVSCDQEVSNRNKVANSRAL